MPQHRSLKIHRFLQATGPDLVEKYFLKLFPRKALPQYLIGMNPDYALFLLDQIDELLKAVILEDFRRVNDISQRRMGLPFQAARQFGVPAYPEERPEAVAMRLFLNHPRAFNFAWALYSYRASSANISQHWLQRNGVDMNESALSSFTRGMQEFFTAQNRGRECRVSFYDEDKEAVVLVLHGSYKRTVACWQGQELTMNCFRPACEDVLIYDKSRRVLSITVSNRGDREHYVRSFAGIVLGDAALADDPRRDLVYTLEPLQTGEFDWVGNGAVSAVELLEARLQLSGNSAVLALEGDGTERAVARMDRGRLIEAKFRFTIMTDDRQDRVTLTIAPPCVTDAVKKRHADVLADYFRKKGVMLR